VRYLPDGDLDFLGRTDHQVKIRGFRIELGEIESVMREYPGVRLAAVKMQTDSPDDTRLTAWVVPRGDRPLDEGELRSFLKRKLPAYMMPSAIVQMSDLPLTPNGKLDRNALVLPKEDGSPRDRSRAPGDETEALLLQTWEEVLRRSPIGLDDDFFSLGGHSLLAARLVARVEKAFGIKLPLAGVFEAPTVAQMASLLRARGERIPGIRILKDGASSSRTPVFLLDPQPWLRDLLPRIRGDQPVYGISDVHAATLAAPFRLEEIVAGQVEALRKFRPSGPYILGGWCRGGLHAYEMARQLRAQGQDVPLVLMFDSFNAAAQRRERRWDAWRGRLRFHLDNASHLDLRGKVRYCLERVVLVDRLKKRYWRANYRVHVRRGHDLAPRMKDIEQILALAAWEYDPPGSDLSVLLFRPATRPSGARSDAARGWKGVAGEVEVVDVPGNHESMFVEPNAQVIATALEAALRQTSERSLETRLPPVAARKAPLTAENL
jgi:thioesterase domain-containing protein/acyl carrier protein